MYTLQSFNVMCSTILSDESFRVCSSELLSLGADVLRTLALSLIFFLIFLSFSIFSAIFVII